MSSKNEADGATWLDRLKEYVQHKPRLRISVRLTLVYAVLMVILLFVSCSFTAIGIFYAQYHQVELELSASIFDTVRQLESRYGSVEEGVTENLPRPPQFDRRENEPEPRPIPLQHDFVVWDDIFAGVPTDIDKMPHPEMENSPTEKSNFNLVPGVFLKITNGEGDVVYDSQKFSPSLSLLKKHISEDPPFWANDTFDVVEVGSFILYYKEVPILLNKQAYRLHFFDLITTEKRLLGTIQRMILAEIIIGLLLALVLGYIVSQRLLKPIRTMTDTARSIEVSDLGTRLETSATRDELNELAQTFNSMLDRIQNGFKQQQRFVSDASHELRTPVTVIKGYSDMLSRWGKQDEETLQEGLEAISSEAGDMQELIEKLLFLARADQKRQIIHKEPLAVQDLIAACFKNFQLVDSSHEFELLQNDAAIIMADKVTMKQLLHIFIENAIKYTPEGGRITLKSELKRRLVGMDILEVSISDTGIGIAEEDQPRVFQRFYRVDSSRTKEAGQPGGTGLGLSIAKWIAEEHDMQIHLVSELGKGSTFIISMPVNPSVGK